MACTGSNNLPDARCAPLVDLDREMARRRLAVPSPSAANQLSINDGLRCRTLADAYPQAIQLLRGSNEAPQTETTRRTFSGVSMLQAGIDATVSGRGARLLAEGAIVDRTTTLI